MAKSGGIIGRQAIWIRANRKFRERESYVFTLAILCSAFLITAAQAAQPARGAGAPRQLDSHFDIQKQLEKDLRFLKKSPTTHESGRIWLRVAQAYQQLKQWEEAQNTLEKAIEVLPTLSPGRAAALEQLGDLLTGGSPTTNKNFKQAALRYREAVAIAPLQSASRLRKLAGICERLGRKTESEVCIDILRRFFPNTQETTFGGGAKECPIAQNTKTIAGSVAAYSQFKMQPHISWPDPTFPGQRNRQKTLSFR